MAWWYEIQPWLVMAAIAALALAFAVRLRGAPRTLLASGAILVALDMLLRDGLYRFGIWLPDALATATSATVVLGWGLLVAGAFALGSSAARARAVSNRYPAEVAPILRPEEAIRVDVYRSLLVELISQHPQLIDRIESLAAFPEPEADEPAPTSKTVIWAT